MYAYMDVVKMKGKYIRLKANTIFASNCPKLGLFCIELFIDNAF